MGTDPKEECGSASGVSLKQFNSISPIGSGDASAVPVKTIESAVDFYTTVLGFLLISKDQTSAVLKRDEVQIRLIAKADHDPAQAGAFYLDVVDLEALRDEH